MINWAKNTQFRNHMELSVYLIARIIVLAVLSYIVLNLAWIGDDIQITFRQIINLLGGEGITANYGVRVQAFTHPTWFMMLTGLAAITDELFSTTIIVSLVLSLLSIVVFMIMEYRLKHPHNLFVSPLFLLAFSWAFCDYTTSGLENPLSYFLTSVIIFLAATNSSRKIAFCVLALLVLNRHDYALLFLPFALVLVPYEKGLRGILNDIWPGALILLTWFAFSTIYFGSALPNTYYAKLNADYPRIEYFQNGLEYFKALVVHDLPSTLIIVSATALSLIYRSKVSLALALGKIFYMLYILNSGGDFMQGRFFSVLVFVSVGEIIIAVQKVKLANSRMLNGVSCILLAGLLVFGTLNDIPYKKKEEFDIRSGIEEILFGESRIVDERLYYHKSYGLFSEHRINWPEIRNVPAVQPAEYSASCGSLGRFLTDFPEKYWIDPCALIDPFLSRLPAINVQNWRIGHHVRKIPTDYGEYLVGNISELSDSSVNSLLNDIELTTRGELFSSERFGAIWRLNLGHDYGVNENLYKDPTIWVPSSTIVENITLENWDLPKHYRRFLTKLAVESHTPKTARFIFFEIAPEFSFDFYVNGKYIHSEPIPLSIEAMIECNLNHLRSGVKVFKFEKPISVHSFRIEYIGVNPDVTYAGVYGNITNFGVFGENEQLPEAYDKCTQEIS